MDSQGFMKDNAPHPSKLGKLNRLFHRRKQQSKSPKAFFSIEDVRTIDDVHSLWASHGGDLPLDTMTDEETDHISRLVWAELASNPNKVAKLLKDHPHVALEEWKELLLGSDAGSGHN
jgi:hypothetical protein